MRPILLAAVLTAAAFTAPLSGQAQTAPAAPATAPAAAPSPPPLPYGAPIDQAAARRVMDAALAEAKTNGWPVSIAIVEPSGELVAFTRMDGASYGATAIAQQKAWTAARFRRDSKSFSDSVAAGRVQVLSFEGVAAVEGGVLIVVDGRIVGAVGVSGVSSAQDAQVARAGADAAAR